MTSRLITSAALIGLLVVLAGSANAADPVSVGRVDVKLPGVGWQTRDFPDRGNTFSGSGETYRQKTETKMLFRQAANKGVDVVFIVRANTSGKGRFSGVAYSDARCEGPAGTFFEGDEPSAAARSFRCLLVSPPGVLNADELASQQILGPLRDQGLKLAPKMHLVIAKQYANTGAFVDVTALLAPEALPPASGETGGPQLPAAVSAASAQWGRLLQKAVTDSVYSVWGNLPVPDLVPAASLAPSN